MIRRQAAAGRWVDVVATGQGCCSGAKGNSHGIGNAVSGDGTAKACSPRLGCEPHRAAVAGSVAVLKPRRHERIRGMDDPSGLSRMIADAKDGIRPRSSLRWVGPEVSQSTFARIRRPVINDVTIGIFEKFASLPSRGNFPGGALQTFHPGGYDVPAEFGGVLGWSGIKHHQLHVILVVLPDVLDPEGDCVVQAETEVGICHELVIQVPEIRFIMRAVSSVFAHMDFHDPPQPQGVLANNERYPKSELVEASGAVIRVAGPVINHLCHGLVFVGAACRCRLVWVVS